MIGKFDPVLYFRHGSNTLDVCGPIFWDLPRDQNLEIRVEVELFQSGQSVNGNTGGTHFRPPDDEWMIYINTNNLVPGSAFGEEGEGFVRMTIAASDEDVEAGFRKIVEWAEKQ